MKRLSLALLASLLLPSLAMAAPLAAKVSPDRVTLGQPFSVAVDVAHPKGVVPTLASTSLGDFSLLGVSEREERGVTHLVARLALYRLGAHQLPPLTIDVGGQPLTTPPLTITAMPTLPPKAKPVLADIHAPVALTRLSPVVIVALALVVASLILAAVMGTRRYLQSRTLEARTRKQLRRLVLTLAGGDYERFFVAWTELVRGYIGARFGVDALECTTAELAQRLAQGECPGPDVAALTAWLHRADLVKFARDASDDDTARRALAFADALITHTTLAANAKGAPRALAVS